MMMEATKDMPQGCGYYVPGEYFEKFAELIVKECANIANKQFIAALALDERGCLTAAEIKKHFGVEE
jgi:hypothetical protein